ncbi:MAG: hypothetical protein IT452_02430 [Planctomycetia bacterium]|nr:hypothetical protein [Planctomycetia bacterium]
MHPVPVGDFPSDESPYGVRGLAGNARDACLNDPGKEQRQWRMFRGGSWVQMPATGRLCVRTGGVRASVSFTAGFRLAVPARLGGEAQASSSGPAAPSH